MSGAAYYNEHDQFAAAWLRNLITAGLIAPGDVDTRSIEDVTPDDLRGYTQCHFFAGIGVWSYALRLAGWPDDRPVWTGSCPCQPFSAAGKRGGTADERHLWPAFFHLIDFWRPATVFGEQVASKDGLNWLDLVSADMEGASYAFGASDLCAAGLGAPHIRQRLWFVGTQGLHDATGTRLVAEGKGSEGEARYEARLRGPECGRVIGGMDHHHHHQGPQGYGRSREIALPEGRQGTEGHGASPSAARGMAHHHHQGEGGRGIQGSGKSDSEGSGTARERSPGFRADGGLADVALNGRREERANRRGSGSGDGEEGVAAGCSSSSTGRLEYPNGGDAGAAGLQRSGEHGLGAPHSGAVRRPYQGPRVDVVVRLERPCPTNGHWRDADWLYCRDGRWRPVEPGTFPLAHGAPARVGRLRAYGNAIVADVAATFIAAALDIIDVRVPLAPAGGVTAVIDAEALIG